MHLTLRPGRTARKAAAHARSASQPCRHSHPALARVDGAVRALRSWTAWACRCGAADRSSSFEGIARVEAALAALGDLLATPRAAAALRGAAAAADGEDDDRVLDAFLALADAYGTLGTALLAARQSAAEARAGVRRGDAEAVAASVRAHRRAEKDMRRVADAMRHATAPSSPPPADAPEAEVVDMVAEVAEAAAEASGVVVLHCAAMSPDVSGVVHQMVSSHSKWLERLGVVPEAKKATPETAAAALDRLEELEECISGLESGSEKVFRRLLQTRVLLLNIHNPL